MWGQPPSPVPRAELEFFRQQPKRLKKQCTKLTEDAMVSNTTQRTIFRWIHLVFSIPILGYIYSPFDKLPQYAPKTRYFFVPVMILSGLWMWKGHLVRRLISKEPQQSPLKPKAA
jgi:hypothetical protein